MNYVAKGSGGSWNIPGTWGASKAPTPSDNVTIPAGATVTISPGLMVTVNKGATITISGGSLAVEGFLANYGMILNSGNMTIAGQVAANNGVAYILNYGSIENNDALSIRQPNGVGYVTAPGNIAINGSLQNFGNMNNGVGPRTNTVRPPLKPGSGIPAVGNPGSVINSQAIITNNEVLLNQRTGVIINTGIINNNNEIENYGTIHESKGTYKPGAGGFIWGNQFVP
jgi:hypothetical protein